MEAKPTVPLVATIVWGVSFFPGLLGAALSPMFFDAPGSMNNPAAIANALIVVSFPVLCIISIAGSWLVWSVRKRPSAPSRPVAQIAIASLPLLPVVYVAAVLAVGMVSILLSGQPMGLHSTIIRH